MANQSIELEAEAIKTLSTVLENLNPQSRSAVIEYVFRRLNLAVPGAPTPVAAEPAPAVKKRGRRPGTKLVSGRKKPGRPARNTANSGKRRGRPRKPQTDVSEAPAPPAAEPQPQA